MSRISHGCFVVSFAALAVLGRTASADAKEEAKLHVERAMQLYNEGKAADALDELYIANQLDPSPELLYAIAQAHVVLERCEEAIKYYEQFLASKPKEGPEKLAREAIDHCKSVMKTEPKPAEPPPPVVTPAPIAPPTEPVDRGTGSAWYADPLAIGLTAGGVIAGIAGVVLYRNALSDFDAAQTAPDYAAHHQLIDHGKTTRAYAAIAGVGGVALVGAGITMFVLKKRSTDTNVAVTPTRGGGVMTWIGRF